MLCYLKILVNIIVMEMLKLFKNRLNIKFALN